MNNQNNKILYGIGGIVIGILLVSVITPMFRYGGYGMMNWGNNQVPSQVEADRLMAVTADVRGQAGQRERRTFPSPPGALDERHLHRVMWSASTLS